jgi:hypothetical protein
MLNIWTWKEYMFSNPMEFKKNKNFSYKMFGYFTEKIHKFYDLMFISKREQEEGKRDYIGRNF